MERAKSVLIYLDNLPAIRELSNEEAGRMLLALLEYAESGALPDFSDNRLLRVLFNKLKNDHDRNEARYVDKCRKNRENAKYKEWLKKHPGQPFDVFKRQTEAYNMANGITDDEPTPAAGDYVEEVARKLSFK